MESEQVKSFCQHSCALHRGTCHPQVSVLAVVTRLGVVAVTHLGHLGYLLVFYHMNAEAFRRHLLTAPYQAPHTNMVGGIVENLLVTAFVSEIHRLAHLCRHRVVGHLSLESSLYLLDIGIAALAACCQ